MPEEEMICPIMTRFDKYIYCIEGRIQPWMKCKCRAWVEGKRKVRSLIDDTEIEVEPGYCRLIGKE